MVARTKKVDAGKEGFCPLIKLEEKYNCISDNTLKIIARRVDSDHGEITNQTISLSIDIYFLFYSNTSYTIN